LIHLDEISCLFCLQVFETIFIPHAVWLETVGENRISQDRLRILPNVQEFSIPRSEAAQFLAENDVAKLHAGEQECLCLCLHRSITTLLTDDMAVRDAAKRLGIIPVGSLGIIVMAHKRAMISREDAEQGIADLYDVSSLFVTRDIVDLAVAQLHKRIKEE
jgi:predicted nucleic acid-binding protein